MSSFSRDKSEDADAVLSPPPPAEGGSGLNPAALQATPGSAFLITAFFVSLVIPVFFEIGTFRFSPYRLILFIMFLPLVGSWLSGGCGKINKVDLLMAAFCGWSFIATMANHGSNQIPFAGMFIVETFGAYLLARRYIRTLVDFARIGRMLFWILLVFIPFGYFEATTTEPVYISMFSFLGDTIPSSGIDIRWGLDRAQLAFEHPILYGMFAASTFSLVWYSPRKDWKTPAGIRRAWATLWATFYSLSSGAFIPLGIQIGLMGYNWVLRSQPWRWKALVGVGVVAYIALDLASNRTPFTVLASKLAFSGSTYYWRVLIFQYGIQNVWADPLFGVGLFDWARPYFMKTATVDNFWLVIAMRYGVPGALLFIGVYALNLWSLVFAKLPQDIISKQRYALVFVFVGLAAGISTVWLWNAVYAYFIFLLGAGAWLYDPTNKAVAPVAPAAGPVQGGTGGNGEKQTGVLRTRQTKLHPPAARRSAAGAAPKDRQPRQYSRVKPGAAAHEKNQNDPDKRH